MMPNSNLLHPLLFLLIIFLPANSLAARESESLTEADKNLLLRNPVQFIDSNIREQFSFFGLASFYNNVRYFRVRDNKLIPIIEDGSYTLTGDDQFIVTGRFTVLLVQAAKLDVTFSNDLRELAIKSDNDADLDIRILDASSHADANPILDELRYSHLVKPLAILCRLIESSLVAINCHLISNWGITIIVYCVLLKILLIPLSVVTVRLQRKVNQQRRKLAPKIQEIKAAFKGEEAHKRIMRTHKELGISPFYALKPIGGLLIQIPIMIATFNALGEMPQLRGESFLWITDLAYPDAIYNMPLSVPLLGITINALPALMTVVTIFSTLTFQNKDASEVELRREKRKLYLMAFAFFVLFYPFPSAMVLYWLQVNILQAIQQQIIKL